MSLWTILDGGLSLPGKTRGQRLAYWIGRRLALRHRKVSLGDGCRISPRAMIHPRGGSIRMGADCQVGPYAIVQGAVTLGDNCSIQAFSLVIGSGEDAATTGITIGSNVRIAPHVMILSADHVFADPDKPIRTQGMSIKPVVIEDDVWIAGRVNITAGVRIGRGSVIGAGAVVTKDIPPYSVAVGVPARVIKRREASAAGEG